jgi:CheY-like chemotaxis protein
VIRSRTGGEPEDRQAAKDAGFDYHLAKPVDFKTIESTLATVAGT